MKNKMLYNFKIVIPLMVSVFSFQIEAGCLDGITATSGVVSKVKGIMASKDTGYNYVILDKATCTASTSDGVSIGGETQKKYIIYIDSADKLLIATLLSAQARNEDVYFGLSPLLVSNVNQLRYAISPVSEQICGSFPC